MITLRNLEYFITVADEGSFTKAAELLRVTQPALSHQIRALERHVGAELLERNTRGIRPTAAGRAMLPFARATLADAAAAGAAVRQAAGLGGGELRLATVYSISLGLLPAALREWNGRHPGVDVRLFEHRHTGELESAMAAGQADLAIGPRPDPWAGPVHALGSEKFVVTLPADDPLAATPAHSVKLHDLRERRWVHFSQENGLAEVVDQACAQAGFQPKVAVRAEQTAAVPSLSAAGIGPALVPASVVPRGHDGRVLDVSPPLTRPLVAYARTALDSASTAFLAALRDATADMLIPAGREAHDAEETHTATAAPA